MAVIVLPAAGEMSASFIMRAASRQVILGLDKGLLRS